MNKEIVNAILNEIDENNVTELSAIPIKKQIEFKGEKVDTIVGWKYTISVEN